MDTQQTYYGAAAESYRADGGARPGQQPYEDTDPQASYQVPRYYRPPQRAPRNYPPQQQPYPAEPYQADPEVVNVVRKAAQRDPDEHPIVFRNDGNSRRLAATSR